MYYFLLCVAAVFYAVAFYSNRNAERNCNGGINTVVLFSAVVWLETIVFLGVVIFASGAKFEFSGFSFVCAVIHSGLLMIFTFLNFKSLGVADLTKYSMFTMLGGMLVPFFYGIIFENESFTVWKAACCVLVTFALILDSKNGNLTKRALGYLIGVFFVNGSFGVITTIHQRGSTAIDSMQYMFLHALIIFLCAAVFLVVVRIKNGNVGAVKRNSAYKDMLIYGLFNSSAELILLYAIKHVDASVQYPIITGGVIVCSALISMIIGENKNKTALIPVGIAFAGLLCLMF